MILGLIDHTSLNEDDTPERIAALRAVEGDVRDAGRIAELVTEEAESLSVVVDLA